MVHDIWYQDRINELLIEKNDYLSQARQTGSIPICKNFKRKAQECSRKISSLRDKMDRKMKKANERSFLIEPTFDFHYCKVATVEDLLNMGVEEMRQRRGNAKFNQPIQPMLLITGRRSHDETNICAVRATVEKFAENDKRLHLKSTPENDGAFELRLRHYN
ncbi:hypothetical protein WR25_20703 [Diploscapter pachys]|uniref:Smr domain-containing protein n=1 Tax=Diploscapter pachys TaxID=2018661 RepID=A0A2A2J5Y3_9BILA|nr:hypothetical protein WR25_20703 [Diploscapter pachys]